MTVSWMSPLINLGRKRQLNEEDVWSLGYEFQHKRLHEQFRELKGSVVKRLLKANGLDLILLSSLSVVSSLASTRLIITGSRWCRISLGKIDVSRLRLERLSVPNHPLHRLLSLRTYKS